MNYLHLNAYNLVPGATFRDPDGLEPFWVTMTVTRDPNLERVYVWARRGDVITESPDDSVENKSFVLEYMAEISLVGIVLHPLDPDDNDWGNN